MFCAVGLSLAAVLNIAPIVPATCVQEHGLLFLAAVTLLATVTPASVLYGRLTCISVFAELNRVH